MVIAAAAVVAFGNMVLIHAQDAQIVGHPAITRVEYRYANLTPIEVIDEAVTIDAAEPIPTLSGWATVVLTAVMLLVGLISLQVLSHRQM